MSGSYERYRFDPFVLDASERLLLRNGVPVPLREKVFETLLILVRNAGRLLTKEEILDAIWPGTHVSEANLNQNISVIRHALGEEEFIQTVPKRGFRFVAPVQRLSEPAASSPLRRRASQLAIFSILAAAVVTLPLGSDHLNSAHQAVPSVSVLPFQLLGGDSSAAWVTASLSETLFNRLGSIPGLLLRRAPARNDPDPVRAGQRLGVDTVVTGAVQPGRDTMRVTAELIDVHSRATLWSGSYDCTSADLLPVEDKIAAELGTRLRPGLTADERAHLTPPHSADPVANAEYLRGRELLDSRVALSESVLHFEKALAQDPNFALAWAGLAEVLVYPMPRMASEVVARGTDAARRAIRLEPSLAEAHAVLGFIHLFYEWNWQEAEHELRFALLVSPGSARFHDWYAITLLARGDTKTAMREVQRAHEIDPQSADIAGDVALVRYETRDYQGAESAARAALLLDPRSGAGEYLVQALIMQHRTAEALAELAAFQRPGPLVRAQAAMLRSEGNAAQQLRRTESSLLSETPDGVAALYASAGDKEKALAWLDQAYRQHAFGLIFIALAPEFDSLRDDPRFRDLVRRVGVTQM